MSYDPSTQTSSTQSQPPQCPLCNTAGMTPADCQHLQRFLSLKGLAPENGINLFYTNRWLSYVKVLADVQSPTVVSFLSHTMAWFNTQGLKCRRVMSDSPTYVSRALARICLTEGAEYMHVAEHAQKQRQDRAAHPEPMSGAGLNHGQYQLGSPAPLAASLPGDL